MQLIGGVWIVGPFGLIVGIILILLLLLFGGKLIKDKSAEKIRFLERKQKLRENGAKRQG